MPNIITAASIAVFVSMYIMELVCQGTKDYGRGAAVSVPLFIVCFALSKYIIAGVALGSVKE